MRHPWQSSDLIPAPLGGNSLRMFKPREAGKSAIRLIARVFPGTVAPAPQSDAVPRRVDAGARRPYFRGGRLRRHPMTDTPDTPAPSEAPAPARPYQVLARKYRPETFADLVGQDAMVRTLKNAFAADRIAQAFIMTGIRGTGKTTTARIIAKGLNCIGPDGKGGPTTEPCGICENCRAIIGRPPCRRDGDGRRVEHRRRRHPRRSSTRSHYRAGLGALQGLHHRRSPHAVDQRLQRAAEDAGRTAART